MDTKFFSIKSNQILGSLALLMFVIALGMYSTYTWKQSEYMNSGPTTISVNGTGEVMAVPDVGEFSFSVDAEGADATTAQAESAKKINSILAYLEEQAVEDKDVKTEYYNLYPKYRWEQKSCAVGTYCPGEQVQDGFEVNQNVRVKLRAVDKAGDLIAGVGDLGATNISGLAFTIDDETTLKDEARTKAIADAKDKAELLSEQLGVKIEKMVGYYEEEGYQPRPYYGMGGDAKLMMDEASVAPEMPTGENTITSRVTITYQVK